MRCKHFNEGLIFMWGLEHDIMMNSIEKRKRYNMYMNMNTIILWNPHKSVDRRKSSKIYKVYKKN